MEKQQAQCRQRKTDKNKEHDGKRHKDKRVKEHKAVVNGKEYVEGSGTMIFTYKKLQVPKELVKKAKKLVETTTGLNTTFIQFIQQATEEQEGKAIRYRHLKAFRAVLADLKKAHCALEEALEPEFRNMELQNGNEGLHVIEKSADVVDPVADDHMDDVADAVEEAEAAEQQDLENLVSDEIETKESQTDIDVTKKIIKSEDCEGELISAGEMSLDHDIMSVPPSVPEELFQMVESLADSSMLAQTDTDIVTDTDTKPNGNSADPGNAQPKVKNLIVKLTPIPVVTTCSPRSNRENDGEVEGHVDCKEEDDEDNDIAADAVDGAIGHSPPPSRRSSRVKTTPLRKQAENKGQVDSSESDSEQDRERKAKTSKKSKSTKKEDCEETNVSLSDKQTVDSDSDEVPDILLQTAAAGNSSDEDQGRKSVKKCLFKVNNTSSQGTDKASKRKRKSENSDSDLENKGKKPSKKKKQNGSDSSDSDPEKKSLSKVSPVKRRSSRVKQREEIKEEDKSSPDRKTSERKRSYEKRSKGRKSKAASKLTMSSSSEDEEEQVAEGDSGEDSDEQKIKPIVEENVAAGSRPFHQSSGDVAPQKAMFSDVYDG